MRHRMRICRVEPEAHRQQTTEEDNGIDIAEERAAPEFLLDRMEGPERLEDFQFLFDNSGAGPRSSTRSPGARR